MRIKARRHNSTYPKGEVFPMKNRDKLCSKVSFVVNQTLVFQIKFCGKSPALRVAAKRVCHASTNNYQYIYHKKNLIQKHITNESNK